MEIAKPTSTGLIHAVRCLSQDADEQLDGLRNRGCQGVVDELALQFHDQFVLVGQLLDLGQVSQDEVNIVKCIDELLERMSGNQNSELWTPEALRTSPMWAQVRLLAKECLRMAGQLGAKNTSGPVAG